MTTTLSKYAIAYRGPGKAASFGGFREEVGRKVQHLDIEPHIDDEIEITAKVAEFSNVLAMLGASTAPVTVRRTPELLRDGACGIVVVCPSSLPFKVAVGGDGGILEPDHVAVWDQSRVGEMRYEPGNAKTLIHVCRKTLSRTSRDLERQLADGFVRRTPMANLLQNYAHLAVANREDLDPSQSALMSQHIIDIVSLILGAEGDQAREAQLRGVRAGMLERIKADILTHHVKPDYGIGDVTRRFRISERNVQLLFEGIGETFSGFMLELRLQTARRQLSGSSGAERKVIDIAQSSGFGDVSYFHKRFRKRFGVTPAELRQEAPGLNAE